MNTQPTRSEHDLLGDREVPAHVYWGVHTLRAVENFPITGTPIYPDLLRALACITLAARCVSAITANVAHMRAAVENSIGIVTALNPYIGYAHATAVAQEAHATGGSVYQIVLARGLLPKAQLDDILRPEMLTAPQPLTVTAALKPSA